MYLGGIEKIMSSLINWGELRRFASWLTGMSESSMYLNFASLAVI